MSKLFLSLLNMSLTASYVMVAVILIRQLLKKLPKSLSYGLWSVVAFRLICPVSFESTFSLLPKGGPAIPQNIVYDQVPLINTGIGNMDSFINDYLPAATPQASINPIQIYIGIGEMVWIFGLMVILLYSLASVIMLKKRLKDAKWIEDNIYEANNLKTPFVLGIIKPKIYLPLGLNEEERPYILEHEQIHIKRYDHIIKPLAFFILALHWFNPLVWISFRLMSKDMELSCDERVLKEMDEKLKKPYANSLLSLAAGKPILNGGPLAFGEGNVRGRIKNVLNYKKPPFWMIIVSVIIVIGIGIGLLTNPKSLEDSEVSNKAPTNHETLIEATNASWFLHQSTDSDMVILDYVSDDMIIFHGYFGLYVYDLEKREIIRSLDLQAINCAATQGDNYCEVVVSKDGNTVQLHPISSNNMYVYTVSDHSLKNTAYKAMKNPFKHTYALGEGLESKITLSDGMSVYSHNMVEFNKDDQAYLYSTNETLGTLTYKRGLDTYPLFADNDTVISSVWSVSASNIILVYTNPTNLDVFYGNAYRLEKMEGEKWAELPFQPNVGWEDIGKRIERHETVQETTDLKLMHGDLTPGDYRLIRPMTIGSDDIDVVTEFILK